MTTQKEVAIGESWAGREPPNGSRLSCGASAGGRKRPCCGICTLVHKRKLPLKAGPGSFKRLLGSARDTSTGCGALTPYIAPSGSNHERDWTRVAQSHEG